MEAQAYKALNEKWPEATRTITDDESNADYDCFEIIKIPELVALIASKCPNATHANLESLHPTSESKVFNILFFADDEVVAGCELTQSKVVWDDDLEYDGSD